MRRNPFTTLLLGLAAAASIGACSEMPGPVAPSNVRIAVPRSQFTLRGWIWTETAQREVELSGVTVILANGAAERSTVTDDDGVFVVGGLSAGEWTVRVSKPGYVDEAIIVDLEGDTTVNFSLAPR